MGAAAYIPVLDVFFQVGELEHKIESQHAEIENLHDEMSKKCDQLEEANTQTQSLQVIFILRCVVRKGFFVCIPVDLINLG